MSNWDLTEGEIAKAVKESRKDPVKAYARYRAVARAAQEKVARGIFEEIEKVENPHPTTHRSPPYVNRLTRECFEDCRQKILALKSRFLKKG